MQTRCGICAILATSQSLFNGVSRHHAPFYGFFGVEHLEEFDLEDAALLLTRIATIKGDAALAEFIGSATGRARLHTLYHLMGGNPRAYVILSQFLTRESLDELVGPLLNTLDELTPYYQAHLASLSNQQCKIVEFLCDWRGAAPVKEIARRCFISPPTTSSQLVDLRARGYVQSTTIGRDSYYELREPLMRLCIEVKKHRGEPILRRLAEDTWHANLNSDPQILDARSPMNAIRPGAIRRASRAIKQERTST